MSCVYIEVPKTDYHVHSQFSTCAKDVTIERDVQEAQIKGIYRMAITDHGSVKAPEWIHDYFNEIERCRKISKLDILTGIECDIGADGCPAVSETILGDVDIVVGALHEMPKLSDTRDVLSVYLETVSSALKKGWMQILAHPTDVGWLKLQLTYDVAEEISRVANKYGVTLELNFHHRDPNIKNLRNFLKNGVRITPTSDAHELSEIGNYNWHESMLVKSGFRGEICWMEL
ncbi:MAG: PHP domain-containing protein [Thermoproteota archaeon]